MTLIEKLRHRPSLAYLALTVCTLFLAANYVIGRGVHEQLPPVGLSFWRWFAAALLLLPFVLPRIRTSASIYRSHIGILTLLGSLIVGSTTIMLIALNYTTAINVTLVNATQPTVTVLITWLFFQQRLSPRQAAGIAVAFIGAGIMLTRGEVAVLMSLDLNFGDMIAMTTMAGFATYAVNVRRLPKGLNAVEALFGLILAGSLVLLPFYVVESLFFRPMPLTWLAVIATLTIAVLGSCVAMLLWNIGNQAVGPNRASIFINLIPVFGAAMAVGFLGETLHWFHLAGFVLIGLGILLVIRRSGDT